MQKKPLQSQPGRVSGGVGRPAPVPPRKMVTAVERKELRQQRLAAPPPAAAVSVAAAASNEALKAEVDRFNALQADVLLTSVKDDLEDIESALNELPANLENIRARGYVFKSYLEKKVETLTTQWKDLRPRMEEAIRTQGRGLQSEASNVQNVLNRGSLAGVALTNLESKVKAVLSSLHGMYDTLDANVNQTQQQIDDVSWTLQQAEQASYEFYPTEAALEAVPANWKKERDKDGVSGVLLLTDQRLVFEQKEEVATKKVLFIATEKEKLQSLQWEVPVAEIEKAMGSKRGFMGKDDFLTLNCSPNARYREMEVHLKGETGEAWQGFINRVKSREIEKERTLPVSQAAAETAASAPTKCSNCGGTFSKPVMRGQTEIVCEFCGSVTRLG